MTATAPIPPVDVDDLRATIERLAGLERGATSPGEAEAAAWIAARLEAEGCAVAVEEAPAYKGFAATMALLSAVAAGAGVLAGRGGGRSRALATTLALAAGAAVAEDVANGPRLARRLHSRRGTTQNVVARTGDEGAERTLVVLAHHDAAPTGAIFDPTLQELVGDRFPGVIERVDTAAPLWWPVIAGPALVALGALTGRSGPRRAGTVLALGSVAAFADIARHRSVPGANDNLTAVAGIVRLAARLREQPVAGLRVLLVSCGAEEPLQEGMRAFVAAHRHELPAATTSLLCLETIGSPNLHLLEGEGPVRMEDYAQPAFRELVKDTAARAGIALRPNMRARSSTDAIIGSREGWATATLVSLDRYKALSNYHRFTDVPEELVWETVADGVLLAEHVLRRLADER